jgi:Rab-GTPase-TBC domain
LRLIIEKHQIEPQIYGLRWIRLLFAREFELEKLVAIWDGIIAYDSQMSLVGWVAIAMLLESSVQQQLLTSDYNTTLTILMRYPRNNIPASEYLTLAVQFKNKFYSLQTPAAQPLTAASIAKKVLTPNELRASLVKILQTLDTLDANTDTQKIFSQIHKAKQGLNYVIDHCVAPQRSVAQERTVTYESNAFISYDARTHANISLAADRMTGQVKAGFFNLVGMLEDSLGPKTKFSSINSLDIQTGEQFTQMSSIVEKRPTPTRRQVPPRSNTSPAIQDMQAMKRDGSDSSFVYPPPAKSDSDGK